MEKLLLICILTLNLLAVSNDLTISKDRNVANEDKINDKINQIKEKVAILKYNAKQAAVQVNTKANVIKVKAKTKEDAKAIIENNVSKKVLTNNEVNLTNKKAKVIAKVKPIEKVKVVESNITKNDDLPLKELTHELIPISKTVFKVVNRKTRKAKTVDLTGKPFIIVSVREKGSDGRFYAVDKDGTIWWSGGVTSGAPAFRSPSGVFPLIEKKRHYSSKEFPSEDGENNMDFMMKFTPFGHALHQGSVDSMSHGCIHLDPRDVPIMYKWSKLRMAIVITRHSFMPYAYSDLERIYLRR